MLWHMACPALRALADQAEASRFTGLRMERLRGHDRHFRGASSMTVLIIGLLLFLGVHSVRIVADDWRAAQIARMGEGPWKGAYTLLSIVGLVLVVWGYGMARQVAVPLWHPPVWTSHLAAPLMLVSFILLAASKGPRNPVRARLHHPMLLGVKVWALAHLLANGTLADVLLFGSFLLWAVLAFRAARQRDRDNGTLYPPGTARGLVITLAVGVALWAAFAFGLHAWLFGVAPLG